MLLSKPTPTHSAGTAMHSQDELELHLKYGANCTAAVAVKTRYQVAFKRFKRCFRFCISGRRRDGGILNDVNGL